MTNYDHRFQQHQRRYNNPPRRNNSPTQQEQQHGERIAARLIEHATRYNWTPDMVQRRLAASCVGGSPTPAKRIAGRIILRWANDRTKGGRA